MSPLSGAVFLLTWTNESEKQVYARRFDGNTWSAFGPSSDSAGGITNGPSLTSGNASVSRDREGIPYVSFTYGINYLGNSEIYALRWNGLEWSYMGTSPSTGRGVSATEERSGRSTIAVIDVGTFVSWQDFPAASSDYALFVRRWNGSQWAPLVPGDTTPVTTRADASLQYTMSAKGASVCVASAQTTDIEVRCATY